MLFFAMVIGVYLATYELLFPITNKTPTADDVDKEDNG